MSKTEMEKACDIVMGTFHKYSRRAKDNQTDLLDAKEFKKMVDEQFPHCLVNFRQPGSIDALFNETDKDKDGLISFQEFMAVLAKFLVCCHDKFHEGDDPQHH